MLITKSGTAIRMAISTISLQGRATQGVKLIELQKRNDTLMFGCTVPKEDEEVNGENGENGDASLNGENGDASLNGENAEN